MGRRGEEGGGGGWGMGDGWLSEWYGMDVMSYIDFDW